MHILALVRILLFGELGGLMFLSLLPLDSSFVTGSWDVLRAMFINLTHSFYSNQMHA